MPAGHITVFTWNSGHWDGQSKWYWLFAAVAAVSAATVYAVRVLRNRGKRHQM
jgi:anti-sigma-K factor RskA